MTVVDREILRRDRLAETYAELAIRLGLLGLFLYWSLILVRPFLGVIVWSVVLCVAVYPIFEWIAGRLGGRRRLAAFVTTALSLVIVIGPATWLVLGIIESVRLVAEQSDTFLLPPPSESVKQWPLVGEQIFQFWDLAVTNMKAALVKIAPHLGPLRQCFVADRGRRRRRHVEIPGSRHHCGLSFRTWPRICFDDEDICPAGIVRSRRAVRQSRGRVNTQCRARSARSFRLAGYACGTSASSLPVSRRQP